MHDFIDWMVIMTNRKNMSIMELAYQILQEEDKAMSFIELYDRICAEKEISDEEKAENISQIYTDFITSAKFIYVGDDEWDIKGRQTIDLWDKDGAYYDEYPDYEEELSLYDDEKGLEEYSMDDVDEEEEEEESPYEDDFDEDDIEDDDSEYDEFEDEEEDYIEDEEDLMFEDDEEEEEEKDEFVDFEEEEEEFDTEEYNEYMDDYEEMYED
jgi:DNA-directed RNA polymerase subunit delta